MTIREPAAANASTGSADSIQTTPTATSGPLTASASGQWALQLSTFRDASLAPVVVSSGAIVDTTSLTYSVPVPTGVVAGSLIVAYIYGAWFSSTTPTTAAFTPPAGQGWVIKDIVSHLLNGPNQHAMIVAYKYATGADSGSYSWTTNALGAVDPSFSSGVALRVTGGATSGDPFADAIQKGSSADGSSSVVVASFTPGGDSTLLVGFAEDANGATVSLPGGWTSLATSTGGGASGGSVLGDLTQSTAAATGTLTFTSTDSTFSKLALVGTFRAPGIPSGLRPPPFFPPLRAPKFYFRRSVQGIITVATQTVSFAMTGAGTLAITPVDTILPVISMSGSSSLSISTVDTITSTVTMSSSGSLAIVALDIVTGVISFTGSGSLSITPLVTKITTLTMSGIGTFSITSLVTEITAITFNGSSTLAIAGIDTVLSLVTFTSSGTLSITPLITHLTTVAMTGLGSMSITATDTIFSTVTMSGIGSLAIAISGIQTAAIAMSSSGSLSITTLITDIATIAMTGGGILTIATVDVIFAIVSMVGNGSLVITPLVTKIAVIAMTGSSSLSVTGIVLKTTTIAMVGSGSLAVIAVVTRIALISMTGSTSLSLVGVDIVIGLITMSGFGVLAVVLTPGSTTPIVIVVTLGAFGWLGSLVSQPVRDLVMGDNLWSGQLGAQNG